MPTATRPATAAELEVRLRAASQAVEAHQRDCPTCISCAAACSACFAAEDMGPACFEGMTLATREHHLSDAHYVARRHETGERYA